jgi:hypothetical protein
MSNRAARPAFLLALSLLLAGLLTVSGCGPRALVPAQGRVTLDGQPLPDVVVSFHLESGGGLPAQGTTDADGRFTLAGVDAPGARPGTYKVTVTRAERVAGAGPGRVVGTGEHKETFPGRGHVKRSPAAPATGPALPAVYGDTTRTPLRVEVAAGGSTALEIALSSQAK